MKHAVRVLMVLLFVCLAVAASWSIVHTVCADAAPPPGAAASDVVPGQGTQVQMVSETVLLDVRSQLMYDSYFTDTVAAVTADFLMRNLGTEAETMEVRFPLTWSTWWGAPGTMLEKFGAVVDNEYVPFKQVDFDGQLWATWSVTFPPGQDVPLRVTYLVDSTGWSNGWLGSVSPALAREYSQAVFYYILETGAGWRGPIGQGDIIFRFPEPASLEMIEASDYFRPIYTSTTPAFVVEGNDLHWHFTNLEPTSNDNIRLSVITPPVWHAILAARQQVQLTPDDVSAHIQLGEAYWAAIPATKSWPTGSTMADRFGPLAEATFQRAVDLAPENVSAQLAYASFLTAHAWSDTPEPYYSRAVQAVQRVLELEPENAAARDLAAFLHDTVDAYRLTIPTPTDTIPTATFLPPPLPMTATPDAQPGATTSPIPTVEASPTSRAAITPTPIASLPSSDSTPWWMWIGVMLLVVVFAAVILRR